MGEVVDVPSDQSNSYFAKPGIDWTGDDTINAKSNDNGHNPDNGKGGLQGYGGIDTINGGGGDDYLYGYANPANAAGADTAADGGDSLYGETGNDHLYGQGGNDSLYGGGDDDEIFGGEGNDTAIYFGILDDYSITRVGNLIRVEDNRNQGRIDQDAFDDADKVSGGVDTLDRVENIRFVRENLSDNRDNTYSIEDIFAATPTSGDDTLTGTDGPDEIDGLGGDDGIYGLGGGDDLRGGGGADTIDGGAGIDSMAGGTGNDVYYVDDSSDEILEGVGGGGDHVRTTVSYRLPDNVESLEVIASGLIDLEGNDLPNTLTGNADANSLYGYGASDSLKSGPGHDYLDGGLGPDRMSGGAGDDMYIVDNSGDDVVEGENAGLDWVFSQITFELPAWVEWLTLEVGAIGGVGNEIDNSIVGNGAANRLSGGGGNDILAGDLGNDRLYGGADDDILEGGDGNDRLDGGVGADELRGGAGNDRYIVNDAGDTVVEIAGGGDDTVESHLAEFRLGAELERLALAGDAVRGIGNAQGNRMFGSALDNFLEGGGGADRIFGGDGQDTVRGGSGDDLCYGGAGNDSLFGGGGSDTVVGSLGRDVMKGMSGEDTFVFLTGDSGVGAGRDVIRDFSSGIDRIDLRDVDGNLNRAGDQKLSFIGADAFTGHAGEVRVSNKLIAADLDGDLQADFEIRMYGFPTLDRHDFIL